MNVRTAPRSAPVSTALTIVAGLGLLGWRLRLAGLDDPARSATIALLLGAVLVAALLVPTPEAPPRLRRVLPVALAGLAVLAIAAALAGPRPPVPWATAALPLAVLAAVAEEALFRRVLYGRLLRFGPVVATVAAALAFAFLHVPAYGWVAFPVDLGAGLVFGWQRHAASSWTAPAATHVLVNLGVMLR